MDVDAFFNETDPNGALVQKLFNGAPASFQTNWDLDNCGFGLDPAAVYRGQADFQFGCVSIVGDDISGFGHVYYAAPCDRIGPSLAKVAHPPRLPRSVKPRSGVGMPVP